MASQEAYGRACIELYSRLWAELDSLSVASAREEILRLEIHLVLEACDTARWRLLLNVGQRQLLKAILQGVQRALDMYARQASPDAIASAQNGLLDAVLAHCEYQGAKSSSRISPSGVPPPGASRATAV